MQIRITEQLALHQANEPLRRAELFGDGFFTTGLIENGCALHLELHLQRLQTCARKLYFPPLDCHQIREQLVSLSQLHQQATFRISVGRMQAARGYAVANDQTAEINVLISPWVNEPENDCHAFFAQTAVSLNSTLAGLKHMNRLDNVLAATEIRRQDGEALMCHEHLVIGGSRSNLFIFENGCWRTPSLEQAGVSGITRGRILAAAESQHIKIVESEITRQQVAIADAAFLSSSLLGVWPICKIEDRTFDTLRCRELILQLGFRR